MWCVVVIYDRMRHICAKGFLDLNFNQAVIEKISTFHKIAPNSHTHKIFNFKSVIWTFFRPNSSTLEILWQ